MMHGQKNIKCWCTC